MSLPTVALIGRTNVGKSTLFNRLIEERKALTSKVAGTTRDRNIGIANWQGRFFTVVDTGGLDLGYVPKSKLPKKLKLLKKVDPDDLIETNIVKQATKGIAQADVLVVVVDGMLGMTTEDRTVVNIARKSGKPTILVVNKVDKRLAEFDIWQFAKLGLGEPIAISAITGKGVGDMLEVVVDSLPAGKKGAPPSADTEPTHLAIIGKPNVGKSSLLNSLLGEERVIVSPIAHTTRESHDVPFQYRDTDWLLIDTAGIRRQSHVSKGLEKAGVAASVATLRQSDIAVLVLDISEPLATQDARLADMITKAGCGLIVLANKWDLITNKTVTTQREFTTLFRRRWPALYWAPILFISAKTGQRVNHILDTALEVRTEQHKKIPANDLEKMLRGAIKHHLPGRAKGTANPHIYALNQIATAPPRFELLIHPKAEVHFSYLRFLENTLRKYYGFVGTPIVLHQRVYKK